jgi:ABC-type transport system substrate-binding protein
MYTAAYANVPFFDDSLYFTYNSRFVSGIPSIQPPNGPCSAQAVSTNTAANYMYLCSPKYDSLSSQMENAPSLAQAVSFGVQAESFFGANAFTIPIFERTAQFGYLNNGWVRVINHNEVGLPNYFTWLNAWNPSPPVSGTIRQGFSQTTRSVNPYVANTLWDTYIVGNVYDSLYAANPLAPSQSINWMTIFTQQLSNTSLTYTAPPHTLTTYRFILRPDIYFQDARPVTAYDVAFSYLSMVGSGANLGTGAASMTGFTVLGPRQFDISVNSLGPFVLPNLTGLPIVPARYWTNAGSPAWDSAIMACTSSSGCSISQYSLSGSTVNCALNCSPFSGSLMMVNPADVVASFDPIANHIFLGSGPWTCGIVTSSGSGNCTPNFVQNPAVGGSYTLTRFGNGLAPASSLSQIYFRSSGNLALCIWATFNCTSSFQQNFFVFSQIAACYGQPVNLNGPCGHWQQGIGNPGTGNIIGISQVSIVIRFVGVNWVEPYNWNTSPPVGIAPLSPVLYEGSVILSPASVIGCPSGYDC